MTELRGTSVAADMDSQPTGRLRSTIGRSATWVADWAAQKPGRDSETQLELSPLTPQFKADQHQVYVSHLNAALKDEGIRNIALTGRYGAGKSSVLEEFARQNEKRVLFLSLSTLGPEDPDETKTNQIEKELVKQLLHREKPARLPQSRYQRIERLTAWRAIAEATAVPAMVALGLWLFGVFPDLPGLHGNEPAWFRVGAGALATGFVVGLLAAVRLAVHNRLVVSEVSAAGAAITLTNKSETYFDKYLDEIVYYFESRSLVDVVVFEDLDRFNHAGIFEALRELNTLLNNSKQVTAQPFWGSGERTIRFVYALRDSIFEQLGHDTKELDDDAAQAESVRANRTKFFDLVIPLVPFITHRTSRELLSRALEDDNLAGVPKVSDALVDLTARHTPDMRMLTNIRNEYSVFANRLITDKQGMDTLTPDQLFAMVAYKNHHLEEFELILLGRSSLDTIYRHSRDLVAESIRNRRAQLRRLTDAVALHDAVKKRAATWGDRLNWFFNKVAEGTSDGQITAYVIDGDERAVADATTDEFWRDVLNANSGISARVLSRGYRQQKNVAVTMAELQDILSDNVKANDWDKTPRAQLQRQRNKALSDLDTLRIADFKDLAERSDFTLTLDGDKHPFSDLVPKHIKSKLGIALVTEGFIDRYYNMYIAQYYGDRVPANAMKFIVQNVDTNQPDFNYVFTRDHESDEFAAVLNETSRSFLDDVSAYNIGILDYLLETKDAGAHTILDRVARINGETENAFLDAYLTDGAQARTAVGYLAELWPGTFTQVIERADLTHKKRVELVDAALAHANSEVEYELSDAVRQFLLVNSQSFATIAEPVESVEEVVLEVEPEPETPSAGAIRNTVTTLKRAGVVIDNLSSLRPTAIPVVVENDSYALTAANLRCALGEPETLSLDTIRSLDDDVYQDVLENPDEYLEAVRADSPGSDRVTTDESPAAPSEATGTRWTVANPEAFADVVSDLADLAQDQIVAILNGAHSDGTVADLDTVPEATWEALAKSRRFPATLTNVDAYITSREGLDTELGAILKAAGSITIPGSDEDSEEALDPETETTEDEPTAEPDEIEDAKVRVAEAVLSASAILGDAKLRAELAGSLKLGDWLPVSKVPSEHGQLLGRLIRRRVCDDAAGSFAHFDTTHWATLSYAITQSKKFTEFVTPELLNPAMTALLLADDDINADTKRAILKRFDEFIPANDNVGLSAAGKAALAIDHSLGTAHLTTIAHGTADGDLAVRLLHKFRRDHDPAQALQVLLQASEPYSRLSHSGDELVFPKNAHHEAVFKRLAEAGYIECAVKKPLLKDPQIHVKIL